MRARGRTTIWEEKPLAVGFNWYFLACGSGKALRRKMVEGEGVTAHEHRIHNSTGQNRVKGRVMVKDRDW